MYISTETHRPHSSVTERTFNTSAPRATDADFWNVLVTAPIAELQDSLDTDTKSLQFLPDDVFRHLSAQILNEQKHTAILRDGEGVITHTCAPIKRWQVLTAALNPTVVRGTSINLPRPRPLIWAERPLLSEAWAGRLLSTAIAGLPALWLAGRKNLSQW
jgi:hypothetical protein